MKLYVLRKCKKYSNFKLKQLQQTLINCLLNIILLLIMKTTFWAPTVFRTFCIFACKS